MRPTGHIEHNYVTRAEHPCARPAAGAAAHLAPRARAGATWWTTTPPALRTLQSAPLHSKLATASSMDLHTSPGPVRGPAQHRAAVAVEGGPHTRSKPLKAQILWCWPRVVQYSPADAEACPGGRLLPAAGQLVLSSTPCLPDC
jgi:hypothetical protein